MRHAARSREIAELAVRFRDKGVVGFDIAGAEAGYPPTRHLDAFEYMRGNNARFTIHAGEAFGLPSIHEAIAFCGADRLGHGVRIVDDIVLEPDGSARLGRLASLLRDKRIPFEMCPSSNVQTGAVASIAEHPFDMLARLRFRVTVNTDNRLMSDTTMSQEMLRLVEAFGYGWSDLRAVHHQRDEVGVHRVRRAAGADRRRDQAALRRPHRIGRLAPRACVTVRRHAASRWHFARTRSEPSARALPQYAACRRHARSPSEGNRAPTPGAVGTRRTSPGTPTGRRRRRRARSGG